MLQWGRGHVTAERVRHARGEGHRLVASMGPRSCDRGKGRGFGVRRRRNLASMGPRSCDRGKTIEPERVVAEVEASMGPRSCDRGKNYIEKV